jgi:hypothetical protein
MPSDYGKIQTVPRGRIMRESPCDEFSDITGWCGKVQLEPLIALRELHTRVDILILGIANSEGDAATGNVLGAARLAFYVIGKVPRTVACARTGLTATSH